MTKFQALFVKYLALRYQDGQSLRNIGMYFKARYPHYYTSNSAGEININWKWKGAEFSSNQINGQLLIKDAKRKLGEEFRYQTKNYNW